MTAHERTRWTRRAEIDNALFWANVERVPLDIELRVGARFPRAYVRKIERGGDVIHLGTRAETHAVVQVANIVAVNR